MNYGFLRFFKEVTTVSQKRSFAIVGDEPFFKQEAYLKLLKTLKSRGDLDEERFDATNKSVKVHQIDEALCEYPMIGRYRLISVFNSDKLKNFQKLNYWFHDPTQDTRAIFVYSDEVKTEQKHIPFNVTVVCNDMGVESEGLKGYVEYCVTQHGKKLAPDAMGYVRENLSGNLHLIKSELTKAAYYVGSKSEITVTDLKAVTASYPSSKIFDMVDAVIHRDLARSFSLLEDVFKQGVEGTFLTFMLTQRVNLLNGALRARMRGERLKDYMIHRKIPLFQYQRIAEGLDFLQEMHIHKWYVTICEYEYKLRTILGDERRQKLLCQDMVAALCG